MLNKKNRVEAVKRLEKTINNYEYQKGYMITQSEKLYASRIMLNEQIKTVWEFLNNIRNKPEEFEVKVEKIKVEFKKFDNFIQEINEEVEATFKKTAGSLGGGIAAGAGVAAFGPSAAMAIATTFGTASTGTAISTLSGAAATNAALAWLGGGALAAGGGGTSAGTALVALSGPIGWAIGGVSLAGASLLLNSKNKKIANEARYKGIELEKQIAMLKGTSKEIIETNELTNNTLELLNPYFTNILDRTSKYKMDYQLILKAKDEDLINDLGTLINQTNGAIQLLNRVIGKEVNND